MKYTIKITDKERLKLIDLLSLEEIGIYLKKLFKREIPKSNIVLSQLYMTIHLGKITFELEMMGIRSKLIDSKQYTFELDLPRYTNVTAANIRNGDPYEPCSCPIALSIKGKSPDKYVNVVGWEISTEMCSIKPSKKIVDFIKAFDSGKPVKPTRFQLY